MKDCQFLCNSMSPFSMKKVYGGEFSATEPGFEVIDAEGWPLIPHRANQGMGDVDHEHRQIGTVINWSFLDTHEVFETPKLFRISKIKLQLETQPIVINQ